MFDKYEEIGKYTINVTMQGKLLSSKQGPQNPSGDETDGLGASEENTSGSSQALVFWCWVLLWCGDCRSFQNIDKALSAAVRGTKKVLTPKEPTSHHVLTSFLSEK